MEKRRKEREKNSILIYKWTNVIYTYVFKIKTLYFSLLWGRGQYIPIGYNIKVTGSWNIQEFSHTCVNHSSLAHLLYLYSQDCVIHWFPDFFLAILSTKNFLKKQAKELSSEVHGFWIQSQFNTSSETLWGLQFPLVLQEKVVFVSKAPPVQSSTDTWKVCFCTNFIQP